MNYCRQGTSAEESIPAGVTLPVARYARLLTAGNCHLGWSTNNKWSPNFLMRIFDVVMRGNLPIYLWSKSKQASNAQASAC